MMHNEVKLIDCMEFMKTVPDKYYELAIATVPIMKYNKSREKKKTMKCKLGKQESILFVLIYVGKD